MPRIWSNCTYMKFHVSKELKSMVNDCLNILIDNGIFATSEICFLYKKNNIWYLRCGSRDLGFLDADDGDKEFKDLLIAIKNTVKRDFVGVVFPNGWKKSCFEGDFSVVLDDASMIEVFREAFMPMDETLGGRFYWFVPCIGFSEYCRGPIDFVYDRLKKKVYVPFAGLVDKGMEITMMVYRDIFFDKWENNMISVPVYLENGEKFECAWNSGILKRLPSLCFNGLSFRERNLEDGTIRILPLNSQEYEYFDIQEKGKDLICTFTVVPGKLVIQWI